MDEIFDEKEEKNQFFKVIFPFLLMGFQKGILLGQQFGTGPLPKDVFTVAVRESIRRQAFEKMGFVNETTKEMLKTALREAVDEGIGTKAFAKTVRDLYDGMEKHRSLTIARTELTSVINDGTTQTLKAEGHSEKEWSTVLDGRERDSHHEANGQVVRIDQTFKLAGGNAMYPGDPNLPPEENCNCRCTILGAGLPEDRRIAAGKMMLRFHGALEHRLNASMQLAFDRQAERVIRAIER